MAELIHRRKKKSLEERRAECRDRQDMKVRVYRNQVDRIRTLEEEVADLRYKLRDARRIIYYYRSKEKNA